MPENAYLQDVLTRAHGGDRDGSSPENVWAFLMSDHVWARIGQVGALFAGLAAVGALIITLISPATVLVADIHPMGFLLPLSVSEIRNFVKDDAIAERLSKLTDAKGLVKIVLHNTGDLRLTDIRVKVSEAILYTAVDDALVTYWIDKTPVLVQGESAISELRQGDTVVVYVWTKTPFELYQSWNSLFDKFQITFPQGVATKHIYIENSLFGGWLERNKTYLLLSVWALLLIGLSVATFVVRRRRLPVDENLSSDASANPSSTASN